MSALVSSQIAFRVFRWWQDGLSASDITLNSIDKQMRGVIEINIFEKVSRTGACVYILTVLV